MIVLFHCVSLLRSWMMTDDCKLHPLSHSWFFFWRWQYRRNFVSLDIITKLITNWGLILFITSIKLLFKIVAQQWTTPVVDLYCCRDFCGSRSNLAHCTISQPVFNSHENLQKERKRFELAVSKPDCLYADTMSCTHYLAISQDLYHPMRWWTVAYFLCVSCT